MYLEGVENASLGTSFFVDDFELKATTSASTAPAITGQPSNASVAAGGNTSFTVTTTGTSLTYQWQVNAGSGYANITNVAPYSNATTTTLNIIGATVGMNGYLYRVVVTGDVAPPVTSNAVTLTVTSSSIAPTINTQPASQTVTAGQSASFSVVAGGTPALAYQWRRNGSNSGGAIGTTYSFTATYADNAAMYSVFVSNGSGNVTSNNATLTVNLKSSDLSGDGQINVLDLATIMAAYSGSGVATSSPAADLDGDRDCDDADLASPQRPHSVPVLQADLTASA